MSYRYWLTLYRADGTFTKFDFREAPEGARARAKFWFDNLNASLLPGTNYVSFSYRKARKQ